jgi:hypothetical protein
MSSYKVARCSGTHFWEGRGRRMAHLKSAQAKAMQDPVSKTI